MWFHSLTSSDGEAKKTIPKTQAVRDNLTVVFKVTLPRDGQWSVCVTVEYIEGVPITWAVFQVWEPRLLPLMLHAFLSSSITDQTSPFPSFSSLLLTPLSPSSLPLPFVTAESEPFNPDYAFNIPVDTVQLELTNYVYVCVLRCWVWL